MGSNALAIRQSLFFRPCAHVQGASHPSADSGRHACVAGLPAVKSSSVSSLNRGIASAGTSSGPRLRSSFASGSPLRWTQKTGPRSPEPKSCSPSVVCAAGVADIGDADFESEVVESPLPVLVDFHASWCGPCKLVAPLMTWAAETYDGKLKVVKVDVEANPKTTEKYKVYGLPTVLIFESGKLLTHNEGAVTKAKLDKLLKEKLPVLV